MADERKVLAHSAEQIDEAVEKVLDGTVATKTDLQNKADTSSVYNKEESISASTRTALSLSETATPDAALAEIARQLSESGGISMDLLWENASPTSAFAAQSLTVDFSGYDFLLMIFSYSSGIPKWKVSFVTKAQSGCGIYANIASGNTNKVVSFVRALVLSGTNTITFTDAEEIATTTATKNNSLVIPDTIYGIKA